MIDDSDTIKLTITGINHTTRNYSHQIDINFL